MAHPTITSLKEGAIPLLRRAGVRDLGNAAAAALLSSTSTTLLRRRQQRANSGNVDVATKNRAEISKQPDSRHRRRRRLIRSLKFSVAGAVLCAYVVYPVSVLVFFFREPELASLFSHHKNTAAPCLLLAVVATAAASLKYSWRGVVPLLALSTAALIYAMDDYYLWKPPDDMNLSGKVAVVTGANTGIGLATAKALAGMGAHVVLTCRSIQRCRSAVDTVNRAGQESGGTAVSAVLDLRSLEYAYNLTQQLTVEYPAINYLFLNAGSTPIYNLTVEGLEDGFGGMHVANMAVAIGLLPSLRAAGSAAGSSPPRVVMVSSEMGVSSAVGIFGSDPFAASFLQGSGEGDLRGEETRADGTLRNDLVAYGRAKLCNILFAFELNRRLQSRQWPVIAHALHPGGVLTNSASHGIMTMFKSIPALPYLVGRLYLPMLWRSPEAGARSLLFTALSNDSESMSAGGQYIDAMCLPFLAEQQRSSTTSDDDLVTLRLWGKNRTLTIHKDPSTALTAADNKWSARLWEVSLSLLEDSPAKRVVALAP